MQSDDRANIPSVSPRAVRRAPVWVVLVATVASFAAGAFVGYALALGCAENLYPYPPTTRYEFCHAVRYEVSWIAVSVVPPLIAAIAGFMGSRRVFGRVVALLLLSLAVFFVVVIAVVA